MPKGRIVLLSTNESSHIAEEAAHYLRTAKMGDLEFGFSMSVIEEALAFFASLLLFPTRKIPTLKKNHKKWDELHANGYSLGLKLWKIWTKSRKSRPMIRRLWKLHPRNEFEAGMMLQVMMDLK
ncbi:MAG: hypothetical protein R2877_00370 [Bdellovibrionota bacterium]